MEEITSKPVMMDDKQFMAWLEGYCAATQGCDFGPFVPYFKNEDGSINREKTLAGTSFGDLGDACRKQLMEPNEAMTEDAEVMEGKSNDELINDLMIYGNPLKQLVIIEAIHRYVDLVHEAGREETRRQFGEKGNFINPDAWYSCVEQIKTALDQHLGPKS
jgi:hypothetical protein